MMERLEARAEALGAARAGAAAERLAARIAEEVPGVGPRVEAGSVVIEGRGASHDPRLRWIGGLLR